MKRKLFIACCRVATVSGMVYAVLKFAGMVDSMWWLLLSGALGFYLGCVFGFAELMLGLAWRGRREIDVWAGESRG